MSVLIPILTAGNNQFTMAGEFLECEYVGVYNRDNEKLETVSVDTFLSGKAKMSFSDFLQSYNIQSVISPKYTPMSVRLFQENQLQLFLATGASILENIHLFITNNLKPFMNSPSSAVSCAPSACNSCSASCK